MMGQVARTLSLVRVFEQCAGGHSNQGQTGRDEDGWHVAY